jgi:hypothetical protein
MKVPNRRDLQGELPLSHTIPFMIVQIGMGVLASAQLLKRASVVLTACLIVVLINMMMGATLIVRSVIKGRQPTISPDEPHD